MRGIFISYRRDDSEGQAGRLFDDLSAHFGRNAVFMDVAGIKKGLDFRRIIDAHVASCGVLLVIIGKRWLSATDSKGRRRLDDVNDFVCLETAAALSRDIPVVPVLVQDAVMPNVQDLPDALKELAFRNGTELTHARWDSDVKLLIEDLRPYLEEPSTAAIASQPGRDDSSVSPAPWTPQHNDRRPLRRLLWSAGGVALIVGGISIFGSHLLQDGPALQSHTLAVAPTPPATQPQRRPEHTAPLVVAKLAPEADEPGKLDPAAAQAEAAKAAAAKAAAVKAAAEAAAARAASARAAAARKVADEVRRREEIERSTQLAEEQRKRDDDARRIAHAKAEQQRIAAEQAAAARMFTEIATAVLGSRQHNRR